MPYLDHIKVSHTFLDSNITSYTYLFRNRIHSTLKYVNYLFFDDFSKYKHMHSVFVPFSLKTFGTSLVQLYDSMNSSILSNPHLPDLAKSDISDRIFNLVSKEYNEDSTFTTFTISMNDFNFLIYNGCFVSLDMYINSFVHKSVVNKPIHKPVVTDSESFVTKNIYDQSQILSPYINASKANYNALKKRLQVRYPSNVTGIVPERFEKHSKPRFNSYKFSKFIRSHFKQRPVLNTLKPLNESFDSLIERRLSNPKKVERPTASPQNALEFIKAYRGRGRSASLPRFNRIRTKELPNYGRTRSYSITHTTDSEALASFWQFSDFDTNIPTASSSNLKMLLKKRSYNKNVRNLFFPGRSVYPKAMRYYNNRYIFPSYSSSSPIGNTSDSFQHRLQLFDIRSLITNLIRLNIYDSKLVLKVIDSLIHQLNHSIKFISSYKFNRYVSLLSNKNIDLASHESKSIRNFINSNFISLLQAYINSDICKSSKNILDLKLKKLFRKRSKSIKYKSRKIKLFSTKLENLQVKAINGLRFDSFNLKLCKLLECPLDTFITPALIEKAKSLASLEQYSTYYKNKSYKRFKRKSNVKQRHRFSKFNTNKFSHPSKNQSPWSSVRFYGTSKDKDIESIRVSNPRTTGNTQYNRDNVDTRSSNGYNRRNTSSSTQDDTLNSDRPIKQFSQSDKVYPTTNNQFDGHYNRRHIKSYNRFDSKSTSVANSNRRVPLDHHNRADTNTEFISDSNNQRLDTRFNYHKSNAYTPKDGSKSFKFNTDNSKKLTESSRNLISEVIRDFEQHKGKGNVDFDRFKMHNNRANTNFNKMKVSDIPLDNKYNNFNTSTVSSKQDRFSSILKSMSSVLSVGSNVSGNQTKLVTSNLLQEKRKNVLNKTRFNNRFSFLKGLKGRKRKRFLSKLRKFRATSKLILNEKLEKLSLYLKKINKFRSLSTLLRVRIVQLMKVLKVSKKHRRIIFEYININSTKNKSIKFLKLLSLFKLFQFMYFKYLKNYRKGINLFNLGLFDSTVHTYRAIFNIFQVRLSKLPRTDLLNLISSAVYFEIYNNYVATAKVVPANLITKYFKAVSAFNLSRHSDKDVFLEDSVGLRKSKKLQCHQLLKLNRFKRRINKYISLIVFNLVKSHCFHTYSVDLRLDIDSFPTLINMLKQNLFNLNYLKQYIYDLNGQDFTLNKTAKIPEIHNYLDNFMQFSRPKTFNGFEPNSLSRFRKDFLWYLIVSRQTPCTYQYFTYLPKTYRFNNVRYRTNLYNRRNEVVVSHLLTHLNLDTSVVSSVVESFFSSKYDVKHKFLNFYKLSSTLSKIDIKYILTLIFVLSRKYISLKRTKVIISYFILLSKLKVTSKSPSQFNAFLRSLMSSLLYFNKLNVSDSIQTRTEINPSLSKKYKIQSSKLLWFRRINNSLLKLSILFNK